MRKAAFFTLGLIAGFVTVRWAGPKLIPRYRKTELAGVGQSEKWKRFVQYLDEHPGEWITFEEWCRET